MTVFELLVFPCAAVLALSALFGLGGIWFSENAAWAGSVILCVVILSRNYRRYFGQPDGLQ